MRPRIYGSSDSHRFLTSTSPGPGFGTSASTILKFDSSTGPLGRLASSTCIFLAILPPESNWSVILPEHGELELLGLLWHLQVDYCLELNRLVWRTSLIR